MSTKFRSQYNYVPNDRDNETNNDPSETIPGQAFTVGEIMEKYARGVDPYLSKVPLGRNLAEIDSFDDTDPTRSPEFDLSDLTDARERLKVEDAKQRRAKQAVKKGELEGEKKEDPT